MSIDPKICKNCDHVDMCHGSSGECETYVVVETVRCNCKHFQEK